jgi:hypothetical protein
MKRKNGGEEEVSNYFLLPVIKFISIGMSALTRNGEETRLRIFGRHATG